MRRSSIIVVVSKIVLIVVLLAGLTLADHHASSSSSAGTSVECFKTEMRLSIKKDLFGSAVKANLLQLLDPRCQPKENETHYLVTTPLIGCSTTSRHTDKAVVYSNALIDAKPKGMITRMSDIDVPFSCFYAKEGITSTLGILPSLVSKVLSRSNSSTNFALSMKLYKDNSFSEEFGASAFPLSIALNSPVFIEVKVESPDNRLSVLAEHCYATPTQNPFDKVTYDVIRRGCASDPTLEFHDSHPSRKRFTFNSFQFVGRSQRFVFVHCKLVVCNATDPSSRCAQGCQSLVRNRLKRNSNSEGYDFTQGPILVTEEKNTIAERSTSSETTNMNVWMYASLFIGLAVFCLVCLTIASILYMKKQLLKQNVSSSEDPRETRL